MSNCYTNYSFNSSTGTFSLSGGSGSSYFNAQEGYTTGNTIYVASTTLYAYYPGTGNKIILTVRAFDEGEIYDGVKANFSVAYYGKPNGYSSSYSTVESTSRMSTGYTYNYYNTYSSGYDGATWEIPCSTGYYYVEI